MSGLDRVRYAGIVAALLAVYAAIAALDAVDRLRGRRRTFWEETEGD